METGEGVSQEDLYVFVPGTELLFQSTRSLQFLSPHVPEKRGLRKGSFALVYTPPKIHLPLPASR